MRVQLVVLVLFSAGCGDAFGPSTETKAQSIVFGDEINVRQPQEMMLWAGESQGNARSAQWHSAMQANATPRLSVKKCRDEAEICDFAKCPEDLVEAPGSGVTTSVTSVLTAHHVAVSSPEILVSYTGRAMSVPRSLPEPESTPAFDWPTNEEWLLAKRLFSLGMKLEARSDISQSSPERQGQGFRDYLREWSYGANKTYYTHDRNDDLDRDLAIISPSEFKKSNVRALKFRDDDCSDCAGENDLCVVNEQSESQTCYEIEFEHRQWIFGPGPFFGTIEQASSLEGTITNRVYGAGNQIVPEWFHNHTPGAILPKRALVSFEAVYGERNDCVNDGGVCAPDSENGTVTFGEQGYDHCVDTSLDAAPGWSGGPAAATYSDTFGRPVYLGFGVMNGASKSFDAYQLNWYDERVRTGANSPDAEFRTVVAVHSAESIFDSKKDYDYLVPPGEDKEDREAGELLSQLREFPPGFYQPGSDVPDGCDPSTNCSNVTPEPGEGVGIGERNDLESFNCAEAYKPWIGNVAGSSLDSPKQSPRVANGFLVGLIGEATAPPLTYPAAGFRIACNSDEDCPGRAGVCDQSNSQCETDSDRLETMGSLFGVCAPWSSSSYLFNWSQLIYIGRWRTGNEVLHLPNDSSLGNTGRNLARDLPSMYEVSAPGWEEKFPYLDPSRELIYTPGSRSDLLRPPSMQLCPPGSALKGVRLAVRHCQAEDNEDGIVRCSRIDESPSSCGFVNGEPCGEDNAFVCIDNVCQQPLVKGVEALICADLAENPGYASSFEVRTLANDDEHEFALGRDHRPVTLDNYLGNVIEPYTEGYILKEISTPLNCEGGQLVGGITTDTASDRTITGFRIDCIDGPGSP